MENGDANGDRCHDARHGDDCDGGVHVMVQRCCDGASGVRGDHVMTGYLAVKSVHLLTYRESNAPYCYPPQRVHCCRRGAEHQTSRLLLKRPNTLPPEHPRCEPLPAADAASCSH